MKGKKWVQWLGTASVLLMLASLVGATVALRNWHLPDGGKTSPWSTALEICGLLGLLLAYLASRFGPFRRKRWLTHRFLTECFRRWHFQRLTAELASVSTPAKFAFKHFRHDLYDSVRQKMDALRESGTDPLGVPAHPSLPTDPAARREVLEAFKVLRVDHQLHYAAYKLSPDDRTFAGFSISLWTWVTESLAAASLILALAFSFMQFFHPLGGLSLVGVLLAIFGVGVRAWRDGMGLLQEKELYQEMHHRLELLSTQWTRATTEAQLLDLIAEVDEVALEEVRMFLAVHERAQFLF